MRRRALALLAACSLLAACTGSPAASPTPTPTPSPTLTSGVTRPPPSTPAEVEPLVLAVHATRGGVDVTAAVARSVAAGRVPTWAALGLGPGRLRLTRSVAQVAADDDYLAVVPASAVGPSVRTLTVDGVDPLRTPGRYPLTVAGTRPRGPVVTMTVGGDLMLGRRVAGAAAPLRHLAARLAAADLTIGNLESTLSRAGRPRQGGDSFAADPAVLTGLRAAGFDVLSLANNHTGDFGDTALTETVDRVRAGGILPVGAGRTAAEARRPAVVTRHGIRFGFLAFNAIGETPRAGTGTPGAVSVRMPPRTGPLNRADLAAMTADVVALRNQVDVVVVLPHWGAQYTHRPDPAQRVVARALATAGADLIVGGHPHWVQGVDLYGATPVVHSLGNLVFDMDFSRQTQEGMLLEATFWGSELKGLRLVPYRIGAGFAPRLTSGAAILASVWRDSLGPFRTAS